MVRMPAKCVCNEDEEQYDAIVIQLYYMPVNNAAVL